MECQNCKASILEGVYCKNCAAFMEVPAEPVAETPKSAVKQAVETVKKAVKKNK